MDDAYTLFTTSAPDSSLFITVIFDDGIDHQRLRRCYAGIAQMLATHSMVIAQQRVWGDLNAGSMVNLLSNEMLGHSVSPVFLEGAAVSGSDIAGIQLRAVPQTTAEAIYADDRMVGMSWTAGDDRFALINGVCGDDVRGSFDETRSLLHRAQVLMRTAGFEIAHLTRTWFYLDRILHWYGDFNAARTGVYTDWGLMPAARQGGLKLPASTGIGVKNGFGRALTADFYLAQRQAAGVAQLSNAGQKDAFEYGSAFSRGALLPFATGAILELSGTASIDESGTTVFAADPQAQMQCTLDKINSLLTPKQFQLSDVAVAVAFLKDATMADELDSCLRARGMERSALPLIRVVADVCRDDLLFELDGVLVTKAVAKPDGTWP